MNVIDDSKIAYAWEKANFVAVRVTEGAGRRRFHIRGGGRKWNKLKFWLRDKLLVENHAEFPDWVISFADRNDEDRFAHQYAAYRI